MRSHSNFADLLRNDVIDLLDTHLQTAGPEIRRDPRFAPYFAALQRNEMAEYGSPVKREPNTSIPRASADPSPPPAKEKRPANRRKTLPASEPVQAAADTAKDAGQVATRTASRSKSKAENALSKTPRSLQKLAAQMPLPSSPQAVTNLIERSSTRLTTTVGNAFEKSGIPDATEATRAQASSVQSVTALFTIFEAAAINWALIPWRAAFDLPLPVLGPLLFDESFVTIKFPDLFVLLTAKFWKPFTLWAVLGMIAPLFFGWLFNFSTHASASRKYRYAIDPVVFNATKGMGAWLVWAKRWTANGWVEPAASGAVDGSLKGGWMGLVVASAVGVGTGVWEGVLRGQGR